jgi:hypothetical protein
MEIANYPEITLGKCSKEFHILKLQRPPVYDYQRKEMEHDKVRKGRRQ